MTDLIQGIYGYLAYLDGRTLRVDSTRPVPSVGNSTAGTVLDRAVENDTLDLSPLARELLFQTPVGTLFGANLAGQNLQGVDLSGVNMSYANLRGANFNHAVLNGVILFGANLTGTSFFGTDLRGADLTGTDGLTARQLTDARIDGDTALPIPVHTRADILLQSAG